MRNVLIAAVFAAATVFGAVDASAQVKLRPNYAPKIMNGPVIKPPVMRVIPPSLALNRAMMLAPNSKALGVRLRGSHYVVKIKERNKVREFQVNAVTGEVSQ